MSQIEKSILLSKRANVYYLEFARVQVKDGRVMYFIEGRRGEGYDEGFAIPTPNVSDHRQGWQLGTRFVVASLLENTIRKSVLHYLQ